MPNAKKTGHPKSSQRDRNNRFFQKVKVEFLVHELKDPVAVIETTLRALMDHREHYGPLSGRQETNLKRALLSSKKIRRMLDDLLEIGRGQAGALSAQGFAVESVVLEALFSALEVQAYTIFEDLETLETTEEKVRKMASRGICFVAEPNVKGLELVQDETKFRQIVANLIKNALYHRNEIVKIRLSRKDQKVALTVEDDGPGVAPEHQKLIFRQYMQIEGMAQLSRSGHGLGLAGARILARCLGGDIKIRSKKGQGALFQMTLPIHVEAA